MSGDTTPAAPDFILKFEGELTPEQLAMWRALWEAAVNVTEPEGFRVWKAGVAHGRAAEREALAGLARRVLDGDVTAFTELGTLLADASDGGVS